MLQPKIVQKLCQNSTINVKCMKAIQPKKFNLNNKNDTYCVAKGDTGASQHYWMKQDENLLKNITQIESTAVQLPNNN